MIRIIKEIRRILRAHAPRRVYYLFGIEPRNKTRYRFGYRRISRRSVSNLYGTYLLHYKRCGRWQFLTE
uniref:Uncharacterized protein n=1 Tax=Picea glauca TaxID=3330 RepID=A0A101LYZ6_PICGL|nr:hypothetical protein ABT39_MTgene4951 [Picea glauca]QHR90378.1 hypothetical protein Q903MT_gene4401 [Picea sitchensis]